MSDDPDSEPMSNILGSTWNVTSHSSTQIKIQLFYTNADLISTETPDSLKVEVLDTRLFSSAATGQSVKLDDMK